MDAARRVRARFTTTLANLTQDVGTVAIHFDGDRVQTWLRVRIVTDPWCGRYFDFLAKHPDDKFYQATSAEGARIIYSRDAGQGMWFLPSGGMGVLQPQGLQALKEIVAAI